MKKQHKAISLLVAGLMSVSLLGVTGCGPTAGPGPDDSGAGGAPRQRVTLLYPWSGFLQSSDEAVDPNSPFYDERWKLIMDKVNVSIDYMVADAASMADKLRAMIGADDMPDVALSMNIDAREMRLYAQQGGLKTLAKSTLAGYENIMRNINSITAIGAYDTGDGYVAIPRSMDLNGISGDYNYMLVYRKDMAEAAGVTIKDAYTIEEMYDMFSKVKAKFPDVQMASHIWPNQFMQYGLYQYSPYISQVPVRNFYYDKTAKAYKYAPADPDTIKGIQWFKKMYDAGFINQDYVNLQVNEAQTQFMGGKVFCHFNGANAAFLDSLRRVFVINNPELSQDCVDTFLLLDDEGQYMIRDDGNYAGEFIFSPKISDAKLTEFLKLLDYLMSDEGIDLAFFGIKDKHYKVEEDGTLTNLRPYTDDKKTSLEPFGGVDSVPCVIQALVPEVSIAFRNPYIDESSKKRVEYLFDLRSSKPHFTYEYDVEYNLYTSKAVEQFELDAMAQINKMIIREKAENLESIWNNWLSENRSAYQKVLDDLNANIKK